MKSIAILVLILIPVVSACKKNNDTDLYSQVRETAWNSLSMGDKSSVIIYWKKAPVTETMYLEKSVYAVIFNTTDDDLLGPIIVYIDKTSLEVLGRGIRM